MKILLLAPTFYSLDKTIKTGFESMGHTVHHHDYRYFLKNWQRQFNVQIYRLPFKLRNRWERYYLPNINKKHIEIFNENKPDLVVIYNNEALLPETVKYFKAKNARIMFIMGDSPYYTASNDYYLHLLFQADMIVLPDSFWADQLRLLGIKNIIVDYPGFNHTLSHFREPTREEKEKFRFDLLFVGTGYADAWGYKRTLFASQFARLNTKVLGNRHWLKWLEFFPELKPKFELIKNRISPEQLIIMKKCAKVYPVDANPAVLNGIHLRMFDCIAMGVLPLVEYRKDLDTFFKEVNLPLIKNYQDAEGLAKKFISNDSLREKTLKELFDYTRVRFSPDIVFGKILKML